MPRSEIAELQIASLFSKVAHHCPSPPAVYNFSTSSSTLTTVHLFDNCFRGSYKTWWFWFASPRWCWVFFHVLAGHLYIFFGEWCVQILYHFKIGSSGLLLLKCNCCLHSLETILSSDVSLAKTFFDSVDHLSAFLMESSKPQKLFNLRMSACLIFFFCWL